MVNVRIVEVAQAIKHHSDHYITYCNEILAIPQNMIPMIVGKVKMVSQQQYCNENQHVIIYYMIIMIIISEGDMGDENNTGNFGFPCIY